MVGDSYSIKAFCELLYKDDEIRNLIIENGLKGGKFVLRPDSGDPVEICLMLIKILEDGFGTTINKLGYKEIPKYIGLLQGDGIDLQMIDDILNSFMENGYSANNIICGSGGGLIQKFDRDTLKCAIKAIYAVFTDGSTINILKDPDTAPGKKSKTGLPVVYLSSDNIIVTKDQSSIEDFNSDNNLLKVVFELGKLNRHQTLNQVRENTKLCYYSPDFVI
jgi:nicotinamide phosphoribosyltransferase